MKREQSRKIKWGEGRLLAAALGLLMLLCLLTAVNRLPQKFAAQPVHCVGTDLYDFVLIDINNDDRERIERLPGVGEVLAERIIAGRPYRCIDDLLRVNGIGEKMIEEIRLLVKCS